MNIRTVLLLCTAILAVSVNCCAANTFSYTFSFIDDRSWLQTTVEYTGTQLPSSGSVLNLDHVFGDVNGCAPPSIQATIQSDGEDFFGPSGGASPACAGNNSGVVGFAFYLDQPLNVGIFNTTGAGRVVQNSIGGLDYYYAAGSLTIREGVVAASPVPEPGSAGMALTALLLAPFAIGRVLNNIRKS